MSPPNPISTKNARTFPLPEWYLPKGAINASDQRLEGASSSCERWGLWFAVLVVAAVIAELIISWAEPSYLLFLKLSAYADAVVAIGIAGEIALGTIWNNRIQTELRRRSNEKVAGAFDRAAKAEAALARLKQRRVAILTTEVRAALVGKLQAYKDTPFDTGFGSGDGEQMHFVWALEEVLMNAGWRHNPWGVPGVGFTVNQRNGRPISGAVSAENVEIQLHPLGRSASLLSAAEALISALNEVGIDADEAPYNTPNARSTVMHILVGPKR